GCDAALAFLAGHVDLQAQVQRRQPAGPLLGQPAGDFLAVDRMDPVEVLGDRARLVGLDRADEVPLERFALGPLERFAPGGWRRPPVAACGNLVQRLLHVVLAERTLSEGREFEDARRREGLADRGQADRAGRRACGLAGFADPAQDLLVVLAQRVIVVHRGNCRFARAGLPGDSGFPKIAGMTAAPRPAAPRPNEEVRWTLPNCWPLRSRTRPPTCTCRRAFRRCSACTATCAGTTCRRWRTRTSTA